MAQDDIIVLQSKSQRAHCLCLTFRVQYTAISISCPMTTSLPGDLRTFVADTHCLPFEGRVVVRALRSYLIACSTDRLGRFSVVGPATTGWILDTVVYLIISFSLDQNQRYHITEGLNNVDQLWAQIERGVLRQRPRFEYPRSKMGGEWMAWMKVLHTTLVSCSV